MLDTFEPNRQVRVAETLAPCTLAVHKNYHLNRIPNVRGTIHGPVPEAPVPAWFVRHKGGWMSNADVIGVYLASELTLIPEEELCES